MSARAVPFHCPYCGEENLFPHEVEGASSPSASHGAWECRSCLRAFKVSMIGQLPHPATAHASRGDHSDQGTRAEAAR